MSEASLVLDFGNKTHQIVKNTLKKAELFRKELKRDRQQLSYRKNLEIPESWTPYQHYGRYVFPQHEECLPITVSLDAVEEVCKLMNIILLNLEKDGFKIAFTEDKNRYGTKMALLKDGETVFIDMRQGYSWKKIEEETASLIYMRRIAIPNKNMTFMVNGSSYYTHHQFTSRHNKSIESQLEKIYQAILNSPSEQKIEKERKDKQDKEYEERSRIRSYNESIINSQNEQYQLALQESSIYQKHTRLAEYLKVLKESVSILEGKDKSYSDTWIQMIEKYIENKNPIKNRIQYFKEIEKKMSEEDEDEYFYYETDNLWCKDFINEKS